MEIIIATETIETKPRMFHPCSCLIYSPDKRKQNHLILMRRREPGDFMKKVPSATADFI